MQRTLACIMILVVVAIIGFGTWQLYLGNFAAGMSTMPLLLAFYFLLSVRKRRN